MHEKTQNNIVTSLAKKAMSVASPVVPMKEDGGVDHERFGLFTFSHMQFLFLELFSFWSRCLTLGSVK